MTASVKKRSVLKAGFLAAAFMLAATVGAPSPSFAQAAPEQLTRARKQVHDLMEYALGTRSYSSSYESFARIEGIARENAELSGEIIDELSRSFTTMPPGMWNLPIAAIQNITAHNAALSGKAHDAMVVPLSIAHKLIDSPNLALRADAVSVEIAVAERMMGYRHAVANDLLTLLPSNDPHAAEMIDDAARFLARIGRGNQEIAQALEEPLRGNLQAMRALYRAAPENDSTQDKDVRRLFEISAYSYSSMTAPWPNLTPVSIGIFSEMLTEQPGSEAYGAAAVNSLRTIAEAQPELSGAILDKFAAYIGNTAKPAYFDTLRAIDSIAEKQPQWAEKAAAVLQGMIVSGHYKYELRDSVWSLRSAEKNAAQKKLPGVCATLASDIGGDRGADIAAALASIAPADKDCAISTLAAFKKLADADSKLLKDRSLIFSIGAIPEKNPEQKAATLEVLNIMMQQSIRGQGDYLTEIASQIRRIERPVAPKP